MTKLKEYLTWPPLLSLSIRREKLHLYLTVSRTAMSSVLIGEKKDIQRLVYYTSQAFQGVEANYLRLEKIAFTLVIASRKLRHYFQAHPIVVMTDQPIRKTMNKIDVAWLLVQWALKLNQFDIKYQPRVATKAQVLIDFIAEFTYP